MGLWAQYVFLCGNGLPCALDFATQMTFLQPGLDLDAVSGHLERDLALRHQLAVLLVEHRVRENL